MSAKLIADAIHNLPEEKRRAVLFYYFFDMSDAEIAALYQIPRSTVQYRRTSSFELLKRYLEEHAYDERKTPEAGPHGRPTLWRHCLPLASSLS